MPKREVSSITVLEPLPARPPRPEPRPVAPSRPAIPPVVDMIAVSAQADEIFSRPRDTWSTTDLQTARLAASVHPWPRHLEGKTLDDKLSRLSILGLQRGRLQEQSGSAADRLAAEQAKQEAADRLAVDGEKIRQQQAELQARLDAITVEARQAAAVVESQHRAVVELQSDRFQPQHRLDQIAAAERDYGDRFRRPIDRCRAEIVALQALLTLDPASPRDRRQINLVCQASHDAAGRFISAPWESHLAEARRRIAELTAEVEALESDPEGPALLARIAEVRSFYVP